MESEPQKFIFVRRFSGTDLFHSVSSEIPHICNRIEENYKYRLKKRRIIFANPQMSNKNE